MGGFSMAMINNQMASGNWRNSSTKLGILDEFVIGKVV